MIAVVVWVALAVAGVAIQLVMVSLTSADRHWARTEQYGRRAVLMATIFFRNAVLRLVACLINLAIGAPALFLPPQPHEASPSLLLTIYGTGALLGLLTVEGILVLMSYLELRDRRILLKLATLEADTLIGSEPDPALAIDRQMSDV